MKSIQKQLFVAFLLSLTFVWTSCSKDDPVPEVDQEVITDLTVTFTEVDEEGNTIGTSMDFTASAGEGIALGGEIDVDLITGLESGKTYLMEISAYNSIADEDVTEEILEHDEEHQFYFLGSAFVGNDAFMSYTYDDQDGNGNPIGLSGFATVDNSSGANSGEIRIILRHDSDKNMENADNPHWENYAQAGGESDLDVTFDVNF